MKKIIILISDTEDVHVSMKFNLGIDIPDVHLEAYFSPKDAISEGTSEAALVLIDYRLGISQKKVHFSCLC